jgi:hypothetical protein
MLVQSDQPLAHPALRLQVELIGRLGGAEFHRWAMHRFGSCFRVAKIVFLPFAIRAHGFRPAARV